MLILRQINYSWRGYIKAALRGIGEYESGTSGKDSVSVKNSWGMETVEFPKDSVYVTPVKGFAGHIKELVFRGDTKELEKIKNQLVDRDNYHVIDLEEIVLSKDKLVVPLKSFTDLC